MNDGTTDDIYYRYNCRLLPYVAGLLALSFMTIGCSSSAHQANVAAYNSARMQELAVIESIVRAQQSNQTRIEFHPDGTIKALEIPQPIQIPKISAYNPPQDNSAKIWGGVLGTAIKTAGAVVGMGIISDAVVDLAGQAGTSIDVGGDMVNSGHTAGGDLAAPYAGGDMTYHDYDNAFNWQPNYSNEAPISNIHNPDNSVDNSNDQASPEEGE